MKKLFGTKIILALGMLISACGQALQGTPTPGMISSTPALTPSQTPTAPIESTPTQFDPLSIPLPTLAFPDGTNILFPTPDPRIPTLLPTIDPKLVSDLLRKSISIQTLTGINGHNVQRITGWDNGFRRSNQCNSFQWLDSNHLILYPRTGEGKKPAMDSSVRADLSSQHVVINLTNGNLWLRPPSSVTIYEWDCDSIYWSRELGIIINQQEYATTFGPLQKAVFIYTLDGQKVAEYWGEILGVSPSGEKILVDEDTIIDLRSNKVIDLAWHMNYDVGDSPTLYWSSDETRLYRCCFYYADLKTGNSYDFRWSELHGTDEKQLTIPMHPHQYGHWVRNGEYFLIEWDYWTILYGDPIPMFSPSEKRYYDIGEIAEIPDSVVSTSTSEVSPDGTYVWIKGYGDDGQYHGFLVNLVNFKTVSFDNPGDYFVWSSDSKYILMSIHDWSSDTGSFNILPAIGNILTPSPIELTTIPVWHPNDSVLAFLTEQNQMLTILNAKDISMNAQKLPSTFDNLIWSPDGSLIALVATDGSLWQVDYPKMENMEQLTEPMPNIRNVSWSPDGNSIAFVSGTDIYIVDATK